MAQRLGDWVQRTKLASGVRAGGGELGRISLSRAGRGGDTHPLSSPRVADISEMAPGAWALPVLPRGPCPGLLARFLSSGSLGSSRSAPRSLGQPLCCPPGWRSFSPTRALDVATSSSIRW